MKIITATPVNGYQSLADKHIPPIVLVTGASGYVAAHCVQQLLAMGYTVRGTVRSLDNKTVQPLRDLVKVVGCPEDRLQLVNIDLTQQNGWELVVEGCQFVLHIAGSFPVIPNKSIVETAVKGTLHVLNACAKCYSVKKVVMTSSCVALNEGHDDQNRVFTEADWTNMDNKKIPLYSRSKTAAEKAAWNFVQNFKEGDNRFKLTCLNPTWIVGPTLLNRQGTSIALIRRFLNSSLKNGMPLIPPMQMALVDVRDVAKAHILAMLCPKTDGQRILITTQPSFWLRDIAKVLAKEFRSQGYRVARYQAPYCFFWLYACIDPEVRATLPWLNRQMHFDTTKANQLLGITFRDPAISLVDMVYSMIERGILPKTKQYRGRMHTCAWPK